MRMSWKTKEKIVRWCFTSWIITIVFLVITLCVYGHRNIGIVAIEQKAMTPDQVRINRLEIQVQSLRNRIRQIEAGSDYTTTTLSATVFGSRGPLPVPTFIPISVNTSPTKTWKCISM